MFTHHVTVASLQAELLADLDEGKGSGPNAVWEMRRATDLCLAALGGH